jgi:hypothetical protein
MIDEQAGIASAFHRLATVTLKNRRTFASGSTLGVYHRTVQDEHACTRRSLFLGFVSVVTYR